MRISRTYNNLLAAVAICLAMAASMSPAFAEAAQAPVVKDINVSGVARIDESVVLERISHRPGRNLSTSGITEDIHVLFKTGYFEDVRVDVEPLEGGVQLTYIVVEKPTIRRVEIYGNKKVDDEDIVDEITISPGAVADMPLIQDNARNIIRVYEKKRYPLVRVVPVLRKISKGHVFLTYQINEGHKVKIDSINFVGNEAVSSRRLQKTMKTKEWWVLAWLTGAGKYQQDVMEEDIGLLRDLLHDRGYMKNQVSEPEITYKKNREWMDITIRIKEGSQYNVGKLDFTGNKVFSNEELLEVVTLHPGEVFSKNVLKQNIEALNDRISSEGYALASVFPNIQPNDETLLADVTFHVKEGEVFKLGRIEIMGNLKTHDKVIRREIRLSEGEQYDGKKLRRSFQMLSNLNYFSDINLRPEPDPETRLMRLGVTVGEKSTGVFNVGAGYSSVDKFVGTADVTFGNFRGTGQVLKIATSLSSEKTTYTIEHKEPWLFDKPIALKTKVFRSVAEDDDYTKESTGFALSLSRRLKEYWTVGATYKYQVDEVYDVDDDASDAVLELPDESVTSSIAPHVSRDTRDNFQNPHSGSRNYASIRYAGLGGDRKFVKLTLDSSWILPITKSSEFSMRGRYGNISGLDGYKILLYEKYFVGGPYSVRGRRKLGPYDEDGDYLGGVQKLIFNFDYTFPLAREAGIRGDIFFDSGTAYDNSDNLVMRDSGGVGIKWITPIGPLMLFYAKNLDKRDGEEDHKWEFAIGSLF